MTPARLIVGCGYLGRRVAALWRGRGLGVLATTRQPGGPLFFRELGIEPVLCDVLNPPSLHNLPAADTVLYAVGFDRSSGVAMRSVFVDGLANVLAKLPSAKKFLYVSSSSVYGQADGGWVDETSPTAPLEEAGRIVLAAEAVLRGKLPAAVILRFAGIYGPGRLLRQKAIESGEPIVGDGSKWLNLIHVDDGARAILAAESHAPPGSLYNVCDDEPVPRRDFYTEMAKLLGAPPPLFAPPPADQPTPPHEKGNRRIANRKLKEELQFSCRYPTFKEGLRASV